MADDIRISATASGTPVRADDVSGVLVQGVKIILGVDGADDGFVSATVPLPISDNGGSLTVDGTVAVSSATVTNAGTFATQETGGVLTSLQLIDNLVLAEDAAHVSGDPGVQILAVRKDTGAAIAGTDGDYTPLQVDSSGNLRVAIAADSVGSGTDTEDGTVSAGQSTIALVIGMPYIFDGTNWVRGGWTPGKLISAATTNATVIKASAGLLGVLYVSNVNAAARYLKLYNKATSPTVGTDTPVLTIPIPGNTAGAGVTIPLTERGMAFSTGISFAITTGVLDSDTAAVAANEIVVNYGYK